MSRSHYPAGDCRARAFGDLLRDLLRSSSLGDRTRFRRLRKAWIDVVGHGVAQRTYIDSYRNGELVVRVDSSVLLQELGGFMKSRLLAGLQATAGARDVAALRFRLGSTRPDCPSAT